MQATISLGKDTKPKTIRSIPEFAVAAANSQALENISISPEVQQAAITAAEISLSSGETASLIRAARAKVSAARQAPLAGQSLNTRATKTKVA